MLSNLSVKLFAYRKERCLSESPRLSAPTGRQTASTGDFYSTSDGNQYGAGAHHDIRSLPAVLLLPLRGNSTDDLGNRRPVTAQGLRRRSSLSYMHGCLTVEQRQLASGERGRSLRSPLLDESRHESSLIVEGPLRKSGTSRRSPVEMSRQRNPKRRPPGENSPCLYGALISVYQILANHWLYWTSHASRDTCVMFDLAAILFT